MANALSVVMYIIYKKFIIDNNASDGHIREPLQAFILREVNYRINIYEKVQCTSDVANQLKHFQAIL